MKKNTLVKLLAVLVMCFMIGAVLVACGEAGPKGDKGDKGDKGETGAPGANGVTPTLEIKDGYWYINGENTGVKAEGKDGTNVDDCTDHDWTQKVHVLTKHTVDTAGVTLVVCANCGDADLIVDNHVFDTVVAGSVVAPTLEAEGSATLVCECGKTETIALPSLMNSRAYMVNPGNCITPDTYIFSVYNDVDGVVYEAEVSFEVANAYDHVPAAEFDPDNIADCWVKSLEDLDDDICICELKPEYTTECTVEGCDYVFHELGNAPGHVWGEYKLGTNDTDACDCEWIPVEIAECTVCGCDECIDHNIIGDAKGHNWGAWEMVEYPTLTTAGAAIRACKDCAGDDNCIENLTLPALTDDVYTYAVVTEPTCDTEGKGVYTYVCEDESTLEIEGSIAVLGHRFDADCAYEVTTVPTADTNGVVAITCSVCGDKVEYLLRPLMLGGYTIERGDCINKDDIYTCLIVGEGADQGEIVISFAVDGGYEHDKQEGHTLVEVIDEETGNKYYVYKCDKCGQWIVADFVKPEA